MQLIPQYLLNTAFKNEKFLSATRNKVVVLTNEFLFFFNHLNILISK